VPNGAASINVVLSLDGGTNTYCMTFSGTGDGTKFLVKDATAGTCAAPPPAPTATNTANPNETPTPTPPAATPTDTPGGACAANGFPACGGSCPSGQVCQAMKRFDCTDCTDPNSCTEFQPSCTCVPAAGTCAGSVFDPACNLFGTVTFTYGPCPSGEACYETDFGAPAFRACESLPTPVPTGTPATSCPSGGQLVGGYCWWLGDYSANCDATCAAAALLCDAATDTYAGFDGTNAHCQAVENAIGPMPSAIVSDVHGSFAGMGCAWEYPLPYREADWPPTTCSAFITDHRRFCACSSPPPPTPTPTATPTPTPNGCASGGQVVGGRCWYLGPVGASCDATCAAVQFFPLLVCDAATDTYAGADGTLAHCQALEDSPLGAHEMVLDDNTGVFAAIGCFQSSPVGSVYREVANPPTLCGAVQPGYRRFCTCH
jgi:hypothetical protein